MKTTFKSEQPKKLIYRKYSDFSQKDFQSRLLLNIGDRKNNYLEFDKNFVETLMLRRKQKYFEGIISPTLIKH